MSSGPLSQRRYSGRAAADGDDAVEDVDGGVGVDAALAFHREGFAGELVNDVQLLEDPAVGGHVELVVKRPHVIGPLGAQALGWDGRVAEALALAPPARHSQAFFAPEALHALAVQRPAVLEEQGVRAPVAPPGPLLGDLAQPGAQRSVVAGAQRLPTVS